MKAQEVVMLSILNITGHSHMKRLRSKSQSIFMLLLQVMPTFMHSVMEQSRGDTYNENYAKSTPGAVNSTDVPQGTYYSVCENGQENDMYSKLARK